MGRYDDRYFGYAPYVPVAERRAQAEREVAKRMKAGKKVAPVRIEGRTIAATFWGKAWCTNLEGYSDFANRLPRGRTYVRNGSVVDLQIGKGRITALVSGSELYEIAIEIVALPKEQWRSLKVKCSGKIGTLVELLRGTLSKSVMEQVTDRKEGLFPNPKEIRMSCSCPDYAGMCKHIAAVMYGVGNRLDSSPELLFELRGVDHKELIEHAIPTAPVSTKGSSPSISADDLGSIFGIEIGDTPEPAAVKPKPAKTGARKKVEAATTKVKTPATKKTATAKKKVEAKPKKSAAVKKATPSKKVEAKIVAEIPASKPARKKTGAPAKSTNKAKAKPVAKK